MVLRSFLIVMVFVFACFGRSVKSAGDMTNSVYALVDSFAIDSAEVVYSRVFSMDDGTYKTLVVEMRDDSAAGFANDRGAVSVEFLQVVPFSRNNNRYWSILRSKADTTVGAYPASGTYMLYDSLDIADMDTASLFYRDVVIDSAWGQPRNKVYGDSVLVVDTTGGFGAVDYMAFTPDFTPAGVFKVTGLKGYKDNGDGVYVKLYVMKQEGEPVRQR